MGGDHMTRQHFNAAYPAEVFGIADVNSVFDEGQRSKSKEHSDRFINNKTSQKTEKIKETES